jgi:hypothetical protein
MYERYRAYTQGYTYPSMLQVFFGDLATRLSAPVYEPVRGDRVDGYMGEGVRRGLAIVKARAAAAASKKALADQATYPAIAIGEWKALLGEFFPAYG